MITIEKVHALQRECARMIVFSTGRVVGMAKGVKMNDAVSVAMEMQVFFTAAMQGINARVYKHNPNCKFKHQHHVAQSF